MLTFLDHTLARRIPRPPGVVAALRRRRLALGGLSRQPTHGGQVAQVAERDAADRGRSWCGFAFFCARLGVGNQDTKLSEGASAFLGSEEKTRRARACTQPRERERTSTRNSESSPARGIRSPTPSTDHSTRPWRPLRKMIAWSE